MISLFKYYYYSVRVPVTRFNLPYLEAGQEFRVVFALVLILSGNFKHKNIFLSYIVAYFCLPYLSDIYVLDI
jgi:hypothetical protein